MTKPSALGRAHAAALASGALIPGERLAPPADISPEEADEWNRIMEPLPPGFITAEHTTLMRELVRCTVFARRLGEMIARLMEPMEDSPADDERLCRMQAMLKTHGAQVEKIVLLSRSLRITKTAREDRTKVERSTKRATAVKRPWNDWGAGRDNTAREN